MRLTSFEVQGFKNLTAPIKLEGLEAINIIHGPSNVGKSNLLRAIEVLFGLLAMRGPSRSIPKWDEPLEFSEQDLENVGVRFRDLFNYAVRLPIEFAVAISLGPTEQAEAGIQPVAPNGDYTLSIRLALQGLAHAVSIGPLKFTHESSQALVQRQQLMRFLFEQPLAARVSLIGVHRDLEVAVDALYDASTSDDRKRAMQWTRFTEVMANFNDILGEGKFVVVLPRESKNARLLYETPTMRVPLDALGSGVQQLVALFGHLLTAGAAVTMIEEPELNLRWSLQERVRDVLRELVGKEGAPSQLFITSHAGTFEAGKEFLLMMPGEHGPTVERRPVSQLSEAVGGPLPDDPENPPRAPTRVTSEGVLRLPDRIRTTIGVERGGNVSFVDKGKGVVEMMSDDTFLKLAGLDDEEDAASE